MSAFTGPQGKGAMRRHREKKRDEAEGRNSAGTATLHLCGHVSSSANHPCEAKR